MPSRHSHVVGGSSAARLLNCPGSTALLAQLPEIVDADSSYSIEGTALHTAMEMLITEKTTLAKLPGTVIETRSGPVTITADHVHDALTPAWAYWQELLTKVDHWQLETEVNFPGIPGAFGTADVLARDDRENITYVPDWKFGSGEGVKAVYPDEDDPECEIVNEQLMFYACAARHTMPEWFPPGCRVVLVIVQPRARNQDPITSTEVTLEEMDEFEAALKQSIALSRTADAPTTKGRWCRFMACTAICKHHTGALIDLSMLTVKLPTVADPYMPELLKVLELAPVAENLIREARRQAHVMLNNGEEVPGWKLVAKRGTRQWAVEPKVLAKKLKIPLKQLYDSTLKSPAGVEKILPKKAKLPEGLATTVVNGNTIAPVSDKRPAISGDPTELTKIMVEVLGDAD